MSRRFRFAVLLFTALAPAAFACQICVPYPKKSAADYLIEGDAVVLAREDPERPFHFRAVEVLKGEPGEEPIDLFLDSSTRRQLTYYRSRSVVLVRQPAKGKAIWKRIGIADGEMEFMVRQILEREETWATNPGHRVDFFSNYLGNGNRQVSDLAHLEIGRAPYDVIRKLGDALPREEIHQFLGNPRYLEWHALYILLLAQSDDPRDHEFIEESFESCAELGIAMKLAAWTTAYIESKREGALAKIEQRYLDNPDRNPEELKAVFQALSVHGSNGHTDLRDRIVQGYRTLLSRQPSLAPIVVRDLMKWERWDLAQPVSVILDDPPDSFDLKSIVPLRAYVRTARDS